MDDALFLTSVSAFESLSHTEAHRILKHASREIFRPGEHIVMRGEQGEKMYVIVKGTVRVPVLDDDGNHRLTAHLSEGEIFGEMALLTDLPRTADVIADGDDEVICLTLERDAVIGLMKEFPRVARFLTEILGKRLLESDKMRQVGKYRLTRRLGAGGMATVYEGIHPTLERKVAIKMLPHQMVYEGNFLEQFREEARTIAELRHPNIVQVYDTEEAYATYFIVMELLSGKDLAQVLKETGPLPFDTTRQVIRQTAAALNYAHQQGVVHRDVKPSNIFLENGEHTKLVDFGIARRSTKEKTSDDDFVGTPVYAAPESFSGKSFDQRADIYSLGITAYHMLTGEVPFPGRTAMQVMMQHLMEPLPDVTERRPGVPGDLLEFVTRSTRKKPSERFDSCASVLGLLTEAQAASAGRLAGDMLTVFYRPDDVDAVRAVLDETKKKLNAIDGARALSLRIPTANADN